MEDDVPRKVQDDGWGPCQHPGRPHVHGTPAMHRADHCRCSACQAAHIAANRRQVQAKSMGRWQPFVPAGPVRDHAQALQAAGMGVDRIAAVSGLPGSTLRRLLYGPTRQVRVTTAERLLRVPIDDPQPAPRSTIDAATTHNLLTDLLDRGYTLPDLAAELRRTPANLRRALRRSAVTIRTAADVARLHSRLVGPAVTVTLTRPDQVETS